MMLLDSKQAAQQCRLDFSLLQLHSMLHRTVAPQECYYLMKHTLPTPDS
jgi:hypothetical protein